MTDKELQKLKRSELLEIMLGLQNELDWLKKENQDLKAQLSDKHIALDNPGSIAQAALEVTGVFAAAQKAADVYLENIKLLHENEEKNYNEFMAKAKNESDMIINNAKNESEMMLSNAKRESESIMVKTDNDTRAKLREVDEECSRRINETNNLCTKKIKETQEKCLAISSLDSQIATFFNNNTNNTENAGAAAQGGSVPNGVPDTGV